MIIATLPTTAPIPTQPSTQQSTPLQARATIAPSQSTQTQNEAVFKAYLEKTSVDIRNATTQAQLDALKADIQSSSAKVEEWTLDARSKNETMPLVSYSMFKSQLGALEGEIWRRRIDIDRLATALATGQPTPSTRDFFNDVSGKMNEANSRGR